MSEVPPAGRLPIFSTLVSTFAEMARLPGRLWLRALPLLAVMLLDGIWRAAVEDAGYPQAILILALSAAANSFLSLPLIQHLLGLERGPARWWGGAETRYLLRYLLLVGGLRLAVAAAGPDGERLALALEEMSGTGLAHRMFEWLRLLPIALGLLSLRFSFALPGAALRDYGFRQSWRDTGALFLRLLALSAAAGLIFQLVSLTLAQLYLIVLLPFELLGAFFRVGLAVSTTVLLALAFRAARLDPFR